MSLGSLIGGAVKSAIPGLVSGGLSGLGGIAGAWAANELFNKPAAETAFDRSMYGSAVAFNRSIDAYKQRYQWTMEDMMKAGLNPILAAGSGGFNISGQPQMKPPTAPLANIPTDYISSSAKHFASSGKDREEMLLAAQRSDESIARAAQSRASTGKIGQEERLLLEKTFIAKQEFNKITQEAYRTLEDRGKLEQEIEVIKLKARELTANLAKLRKLANIYNGPAGQTMTYIQEILKTLNIGIGIIPGIRR